MVSFFWSFSWFFVSIVFSVDCFCCFHRFFFLFFVVFLDRLFLCLSFVVFCRFILCQLKWQLPSFDLGFMESDEFREFYKFAFQFSREGTHRTIERDVATPLLQMVSRKTGKYLVQTFPPERGAVFSVPTAYLYMRQTINGHINNRYWCALQQQSQWGWRLE